MGNGVRVALAQLDLAVGAVTGNTDRIIETARLARDEPERQRLSRGALERAGEYLWSLRGEQMATMYRSLLNRMPRL